jgi:hypothetical protein
MPLTDHVRNNSSQPPYEESVAQDRAATLSIPPMADVRRVSVWDEMLQWCTDAGFVVLEA